jgi:hypothetical protein
MAHTYKVRNTHVPHDYRPRERRLLVAHKKHEASQERDGELLPCICQSCGSVLGLAAVDEELFCVDCGVWAEPADDLAAIAEMPA